MKGSRQVIQAKPAGAQVFVVELRSKFWGLCSEEGEPANAPHRAEVGELTDKTRLFVELAHGRLPGSLSSLDVPCRRRPDSRVATQAEQHASPRADEEHARALHRLNRIPLAERIVFASFRELARK